MENVEIIGILAYPKIDKVTKNYTLFYINIIPGFTGSRYVK